MSASHAGAVKQSNGLVAGMVAFGMWGLAPLFWRLLKPYPAPLILFHRILWATACLLLWLALARRSRPTTWRVPGRILRQLLASSFLAGCNWGLYVWAVNSGHVVETSLGYFINPLLSVVLGVTLLGERLSPRQWCAVALAAGGVAWLTWEMGHLPWIALGLALTFGLYGLLRKLITIDAVVGSAIEGLYLAPVALVALALHPVPPQGHPTPTLWMLLVAGGFLSVIPTLAFVFAVRQLPLSVVGFLQYIAPTLQFLTGVFVFHETFTPAQAAGFGLIWLGLGVYASSLRRKAPWPRGTLERSSAS